MKSLLDTRGKMYCLNICVWFDGSLHPMLGHKGTCKWIYDGQVYYHAKVKKDNR